MEVIIWAFSLFITRNGKWYIKFPSSEIPLHSWNETHLSIHGISFFSELPSFVCYYIHYSWFFELTLKGRRVWSFAVTSLLGLVFTLCFLQEIIQNSLTHFFKKCSGIVQVVLTLFFLWSIATCAFSWVSSLGPQILYFVILSIL